MKRIGCLVLAMLFLFSCASALADSELKVRGTGIVQITADTARIVLGVRESCDDVRAAQGTVNEKINAICDALIAAGISQKNIGTENLYIYANYDYTQTPEVIVGYTATNTISITTDEIDRVGEYIDIAFGAGANTLDNVQFTAQDTESAQQEALQLAVQNALEKANVIATAADMTIDEIESIEESVESSYYSSDYGAKYSNARAETSAAGDTSTRVDATTLEVSATVIMEFNLK